MPMRRDPALWFNLPGVVGAYQPVAAPGPLLACYNQAHGGSNLHQAVGGVAPTWAAPTGWTFNDATEQYLKTGIVPAASYSMLIQFSSMTSDGVLIGSRDWNTGQMYYIEVASWGGRFFNGATTTLWDSAYTEGVKALAGRAAYTNGVMVGTSPDTDPAPAFEIYIGAQDSNDTVQYAVSAIIQAVAIYSRTLSPAEVWQASRQMAYCHVNPEWSAWGRRRRYYYAPAAPAGGAAKMNTYYRRMRS